MSVFARGHRLASRPFASAAECMAASGDPGARRVPTHAWDAHTSDRIAAPQERWLGGPLVLVMMGVSGCGKSTVAALMAGRLGWPLEEGDALHPASNIEKMKAGHPLTDADRRPWLDQVAAWVDERLSAGESALITCSALKRSYRDVINRRGSGVVFVYLAGSRETIAARLAARHGHFMPPGLLDSQFADLEEPTPDEPEIRVDIGAAPGVIAQRIVEELGLSDLLAKRGDP